MYPSIYLYLKMSKYRLDRTAFKAHTASEAAEQSVSYKNTSWQERLQIAAYLNSIAYNFLNSTPPPMDKTKFKATSREL